MRKEFEMKLGDSLLLQVKVVERTEKAEGVFYGVALPDGKVVYLKEEYLPVNANNKKKEGGKSLEEQVKELNRKYHEEGIKHKTELTVEEARQLERNFKETQKLFEAGWGTY